MNLKTEDIQFSTKSMVDDFGRIFSYNNKIYRAIENNKKDYCLSLIRSDLFKELISRNYIPFTQVANFNLPEYDLILEHEKLTETLQYEWSFNMLKDAALLVASVNELCNEYGYELKDAHTMNVLFKGTQPMWVDIGSIVPISERKGNNWTAYKEYLGSFIVPLLFWSEGKFYIARKLLESTFYRLELLPAQDFSESGLLSLLNNNLHEHKLKFRNRKLLIDNKKRKSLSSFIPALNKILLKLRMGRLEYESEWLSNSSIKQMLLELKPPLLSSSWENYHSHYYSSEGKLKGSDRFSKIIEVIKQSQNNIHSVLDLAGNQGLLCQLIQQNTEIKKIILSDFDSNAIDIAYTNFKNDKSKNIELMLLNFMFNPNPSGLASRIKSDLVMALAVTHHLVLTNCYSLMAIFERIKLLSNRFVMIEFMPKGLWVYGSKDYPALPEWYTEEWFSASFKKYFRLLQKEILEENRILYFGEIIEDNS